MTPILGQRQHADRSERSFERLYQRHVGDVYRYSLALLRNPSDAEDVTQTTFLNAYRAYRRGERPETPRAWLTAIAHNVCLQRFRTERRRVDEVALEESAVEAAVPDPGTPTPEELRRALGHLAFNQRAALVMRELEGRPYAEIAEILGLTTSAVETLLFRARRALREQLEGALTCHEAELAISRQLDGRLSRAERGALRAHLRSCHECATLARKQRAQRSALRSLALVPLPSSLASWAGGGAGATAVAGAGGGAAVKVAAALAAAGTVAVGVGGTAAVRGPERTPAADAPTAAPAAPPPAAAAAPASRTTRLAGAAGRGSGSAAAAGPKPARAVAPKARGDRRATPGRAASRKAAPGKATRRAALPAGARAAAERTKRAKPDQRARRSALRPAPTAKVPAPRRTKRAVPAPRAERPDAPRPGGGAAKAKGGKRAKGGKAGG